MFFSDSEKHHGHSHTHALPLKLAMKITGIRENISVIFNYEAIGYTIKATITES